MCQTLEANEGPERAASEMADLLYHAMVLLNVQVRENGVRGVKEEECPTLVFWFLPCHGWAGGVLWARSGNVGGLHWYPSSFVSSLLLLCCCCC